MNARASINILPIRNSSSSGSDVDQVAFLFALMANSVRLKVLLKLIERRWSVNDLAYSVGLTQSAVSQHLKKLREAGMVNVRRDGAVRLYGCSDEQTIRLLTEVGLLCKFNGSPVPIAAGN